MDAPLLPRVRTRETAGTPRVVRRLASGYLDPRSPAARLTPRVSNLRPHDHPNNDINTPLFINPLITTTTPPTITTTTPPKLVNKTITDLVNNNFYRSNSAPAICTDEKGIIQLESIEHKHRRRLDSSKITGIALIGLLIYIIVGVTVLTLTSDKFGDHRTIKFIDALYFTVVTLCTIGYGDIVPATTFTKLFTCVFILVGFGFIDILLNGLLTYVLDMQEEVLLGAVDQSKFNKMVRTYIYDKQKGRMRIRIKMSLALGVVVLCLTIGTTVAHFVERMTWVDSFYLAVTSVTTVGYGDYSFKTTAGKSFAIIWLLASTLAVARAFLYLVEYRIEKRNRRTANEVLHKKLTLGDLVAADLDHDGSISKAEYVVFKLREMGKISEKDIDQICEQFDTIEDSHHHRKITVADLMEGDADNAANCQ